MSERTEQAVDDGPAFEPVGRDAAAFRIMRIAARASEHPALLQEVCEVLADALGTELVGVLELLPEAREGVLKAGTGWREGELGEARIPTGPGSPAAAVLVSDGPIVIDDVASEQRFPISPLLVEHGAVHGCGTSIDGPGRPYGFLIAFSTEPGSFEPDQLALVESAARAIGLAIGRLRAERRLAVQHGVAELTARTDDLETASPELLALLGRGVGWDYAGLWLLADEASELRCVETWTPAGARDAMSERSMATAFSRGEGLPGTAWETGEPHWRTNIAEDPGFTRARSASEAGMSSALVVPIVSYFDHVVGVFELMSHTVEQPDEELLQDLKAVGAQVGQLLARQAAQRSVKRAADEMEHVLGDLDTGITVHNPDGSLRMANDAAARVMGLGSAEELGEHLRDGLAEFGVHTLDEQGNVLGIESFPTGRALAGEDVETQLVRTRDPDGQECWYQVRASRVELDGGAYVAVTSFDDVTDLKRIQQALQESEDRHRRIGETLQRGLLPPSLPDLPAIDLAVRFRALGDRALVGGDFYDAFPVSGDRWMLVVGDIAGKGIEAAAFTALVRYTLRSAAIRDRDPARALEAVNQVLLKEAGSVRLCTAVCALIDPNRPSRITLARAGHPPPLLLRADPQKPQRIQPKGELLGAFEDATFESREFHIGRGDVLVIYTDGVSEAGVRTGAPLEVEGIERLLSQTASREPERLASMIDRTATASDRGEPHDDVLVVVLGGR